MKSFFDTGITIDVIEGNCPEVDTTDVCMLDTNLAELYYWYLRNHNKKTADYFYKRFSEVSVPIPQDLIPEAMQFRFENKRLNFSYQDALGYIYARRNGLCFITSDKAFKGLKGVKIL